MILVFHIVIEIYIFGVCCCSISIPPSYSLVYYKINYCSKVSVFYVKEAGTDGSNNMVKHSHKNEFIIIHFVINSILYPFNYYTYVYMNLCIRADSIRFCKILNEMKKRNLVNYVFAY